MKVNNINIIFKTLFNLNVNSGEPMGLKELKEIDRKIIEQLMPQTEDDEVKRTNSELTESIENASKGYLSQRLNYLTEEGFVDVEKEGRKKFYSISDEYIHLLRKDRKRTQDSEFIQKTPVDRIYARTYSFTEKDGAEKLNIYGQVEGRKPSEIKIDKEELEEGMTAENLLRLGARKIFEESKGLRAKISDKYDELLQMFDSEEDREKMEAAKVDLLELFLEKTDYSKFSNKTEFTVGEESFTVRGVTLVDIYLSAADNEIFPDVDRDDMKEFLSDLGEEIEEQRKIQVVIGNFD